MAAVPGSCDPAAASDQLAPLVRWLAWQPDPVELHVGCADGPDRLPARRRDAVVLLATCAADVPLSGWLELIAAGAVTLTVHERHPEADLAPLADARALLRSAGHPGALAIVGAADAAAPVIVPPAAPPRRRGRVRPRRATAVGTLTLPRRAVLAPVARARPGARDRPETERSRLNRVLEHFRITLPAPAAVPGAASQPSSPEVALASAPPRVALLDAPGCTACGVCVRACPAGALSLVDLAPTGLRALHQEVAACTDCGRCVDLCPEHVLHRSPTPGWDAVLTPDVHEVARTATRHCERCGAAFGSARPVTPGGRALCSVCEFRRAHPFGSAPPPGARPPTVRPDGAPAHPG